MTVVWLKSGGAEDLMHCITGCEPGIRVMKANICINLTDHALDACHSKYWSPIKDVFYIRSGNYGRSKLTAIADN